MKGDRLLVNYILTKIIINEDVSNMVCRLSFRGLYDGSSFKAAVEHIHKYSHISGNVLELALEMETLHTKPYRWMYPAVRAEGRADDAWHGVNWRGRPEQPPVR